MLSRIKFFSPTEFPVIYRVMKHAVKRILAHPAAVQTLPQAVLIQDFLNHRQRIFPACRQFKQLLNQRPAHGVHVNFTRISVIQIPDRRAGRINSLFGLFYHSHSGFTGNVIRHFFSDGHLHI